MKIRKGFVTNSSSSSFIVLFNKIPENISELQTMLFGDAAVYSCDGDILATKQIAQTVFNDLKNYSEDNIIHDLYEELCDYCNIYDDNGLTYDGSNEAFLIKFIKVMEMFEKVLGYKLTEDQLHNARIFSYGDDDGSYYSALEHGDIFGNIENIKICHH